MSHHHTLGHATILCHVVSHHHSLACHGTPSHSSMSRHITKLCVTPMTLRCHIKPTNFGMSHCITKQWHVTSHATLWHIMLHHKTLPCYVTPAHSCMSCHTTTLWHVTSHHHTLACHIILSRVDSATVILPQETLMWHQRLNWLTLLRHPNVLI